MSLYVIVRSDGKYVARLGAEHSYTSKLEQARRWSIRANAVYEVCENERVVSLDQIFGDGE